MATERHFQVMGEVAGRLLAGEFPERHISAAIQRPEQSGRESSFAQTTRVGFSPNEDSRSLYFPQQPPLDLPGPHGMLRAVMEL